MLPLATFLKRPSRYSALSLLVGEGGISVSLDRSYGEHPRHRVDVYRPNKDIGGPVALFLYGGSWQGGCRSCYGFVGAALARRGITTAIADYRLYPEVRWPQFQEDAATAWSWVRRELVGTSARPAVVIGHSAGAHMASLLALDRRWHGEAGPDALVGLSGPYTFSPTAWPSTRDIFVTARSADEPRPVTYVKPGAPRTLLLHGAEDGTVKPENSIGLAAALRAHGNAVTHHLLDGIGHAGVITAIARPLRWRAPVLDLVAGFINALPEERA